MRITAKGQVTIPAQIREQAGLLPHVEVNVEFDGNAVRIVRVQNSRTMAPVHGLSPICGGGETSL
jgi:AbrB family looped-hinge helix DNA binding protein